MQRELWLIMSESRQLCQHCSICQRIIMWNIKNARGNCERDLNGQIDLNALSNESNNNNSKEESNKINERTLIIEGEKRNNEEVNESIAGRKRCGDIEYRGFAEKKKKMGLPVFLLLIAMVLVLIPIIRFSS